MIPKRIHGATNRTQPPNSWPKLVGPKVPVTNLLVRQVKTEDGLLVVESAWEPTPIELEMLKRGGTVVVSIAGPVPPMRVYVEPSDDDREKLEKLKQPG